MICVLSGEGLHEDRGNCCSEDGSNGNNSNENTIEGILGFLEV
jgi:hypothetical protein